MDNLKNIILSKNGSRLITSLIAIFVGLLFGLIILLIVNPEQAFPAFQAIVGSGFKNLKNLGNVFFFATPLCLTGLSIAFAFKTNLFNIGVTGQFLFGGFASIVFGVLFAETFGSFSWVISLLLGAIFGGLWALIPGILKAYRNVNEVVSGIMMNYIGLFIVIYLGKLLVYDSFRNTTLSVHENALIPLFGLDNLFTNSKIQGGLIIAIICVIVIHIILNKTVLGYKLQVVGSNKHAAKYSGINEKKSIVISLVISGVLAGIAGAVVYLSHTGDFIKISEILPTYGFDGIAVALLGQTSPIGTFLSSVFFGLLKVGGEQMQLFNFSKEIIDIISSSIVYFSALSLVFSKVISYLRNKLISEGAR